jgi:hypothetical protein
VIAMAAALVVAPMASAGGHGHGKHKHHRHGHSHGNAYGHYKTVPRVIHLGGPGYYSPYLVGRAYYGPHHHHHARYRFPVYVNGAVVYRSYNYCGDNLFVAGAVTLPHLAIGVQFGSPAYVPVGDPFVPTYGYGVGPFGDHRQDWDD